MVLRINLQIYRIDIGNPETLRVVTFSPDLLQAYRGNFKVLWNQQEVSQR